MKKLGLKKETLVELSTADLAVVAGGNHFESHSCPITYTCVNISGGDAGCFNSFGCFVGGIALKNPVGGC